MWCSRVCCSESYTCAVIWYNITGMVVYIAYLWSFAWCGSMQCVSCVNSTFHKPCASQLVQVRKFESVKAPIHSSLFKKPACLSRNHVPSRCHSQCTLPMYRHVSVTDTCSANVYLTRRGVDTTHVKHTCIENDMPTGIIECNVTCIYMYLYFKTWQTMQWVHGIASSWYHSAFPWEDVTWDIYNLIRPLWCDVMHSTQLHASLYHWHLLILVLLLLERCALLTSAGACFEMYPSKYTIATTTNHVAFTPNMIAVATTPMLSLSSSSSAKVHRPMYKVKAPHSRQKASKRFNTRFWYDL